MDPTLPSLLLLVPPRAYTLWVAPYGTLTSRISPYYLLTCIFCLVATQVATLYSLRCRQPCPSSSPAFTLARVQETVGLRARLEQTRKVVTVEEFTQVLLASLLNLVPVCLGVLLT